MGALTTSLSGEQSTPSATGRGRPLLAGASARRALEAVASIADELRQRQGLNSGGASLADGDAGTAIFFASLSASLPGRGYKESAAAFLQNAVEAMGKTRMPPSLFGGFSGVAWAAGSLLGRVIEATSADPNAAVDQVLRSHLERSPWQGDYDLVSGLVGIGTYLLDRLPRPDARAGLELVLNHLAASAERRGGFASWFTRADRLSHWQRDQCPEGHYNLGVAHGVPGVIAFLGRLWAAGVAREQARPLLEDTVRWLLEQRQPEEAAWRYPCWVAPGARTRAGRLAWCYGDLGIAVALQVAAGAAGVDQWACEARSLALRASRTAPECSGVRDAGFCHGAAGVGHLFNRLFQATEEPVLGDAARLWLERALSMRRPGTGTGGFLTFVPRVGGGEAWKADPGLVTGAAGTGLALLAAVNADPPDWDRPFLLSAS